MISYKIQSGMSKTRVVKKSGKLSQTQRKAAKNDYFDQEQENFDALHMQQNQDREYNSLLKSSSPHANKKKNAYFFSHQKYRGTNQPQQEQEQSQQSIEEPEEQNQIASALKSFREERKKQSKLLTEDVRQIEEQDEEFETMRKKLKTSDENLEEALGLRNQLSFQNMLIDYRYNEQNTLESLKRFPTANFPNNEQLHNLQKEFESSVFANLNKLIEIYGKYAQKVLQTGPLQTYEQQYEHETEQSQGMKLDTPAIHKRFMQQQDVVTRNTERQLIKWSNKTSLINVSSSHYSSLLMQTPVGQAKKILSNWDRVKSKCQQKRNTFRILFQDEENVRNSTDPQIFDDFELFTELERGFISQLQEDSDFRINDTLRYLKNRENRPQKTKEVDRKASKNRKLRFNAHPKLLNFMPSYPANLIEARDEIVENFFNCRAGTGASQKRHQDGETYYIDM